MSNVTLSKRLAAATTIVGLGFFALGAGLAHADGPPSGGGAGAAKCEKFKKGTKEWKECMAQIPQDREDGYALGYWLAKTGDYQQALDVLSAKGDPSDPRVLTMIGYATRHLGRVDEALGYYAKALDENPNLTFTRQYLGEAYLQKGDALKAKEQLAEIGRLCAASCQDYQVLAAEISDFERGLKG